MSIFRMNKPWLKIIGISESAPLDMSEASLSFIAKADFVFGGKRHLKLLGIEETGLEWPIPFAIEQLLEKRNRNVVVLASGDPFWFGVGGTIARHFSPSEWICIPGPSTFSLAASRLGWKLEDSISLGLHNLPIETLINFAYKDQQLIVLCKDADAVKKIQKWFLDNKFSDSEFWVMEKLGGPSERVRKVSIKGNNKYRIQTPVAVAIKVKGDAIMSSSPGLPIRIFAHDGQITKKHMRALTMAELSPRPGEVLWDLGAGSGSISIEWCRLNHSNLALAFERDHKRIKNLQNNVSKFGLINQVDIINTDLPNIPKNLKTPNAIFVGGGLTSILLEKIWTLAKPGTKIIANAVTLETEKVLLEWNTVKGGALMRINIAYVEKIGKRLGWKPIMPVLQWSVIK